MWVGTCSRDGLTAYAGLPDTPQSNCGSWLACDGGLPANTSLPDTPQSNCAGLLAKAAWQSTQLNCVHIHCCGNGHLGFRPDGGSLSKSRNAGPDKSKQNALAPPLGTSLRLGVPERRLESVGHEFKPAFGQRGLTGRLRSRSKADQDQERLASHRGYRRLPMAIAGKPGFHINF